MKQIEQQKEATIQDGDFHTIEQVGAGNAVANPKGNFERQSIIFSARGQPGQFDWSKFELTEPNYVNYLCWRGQNPNDNFPSASNAFIACADDSLQVFHVSYSVSHDSETDLQRQEIDLNHLQTIKVHPKVINMCAMLDYNRVVTCSREPIIKLWDLAKSTSDGGPSA